MENHIADDSIFVAYELDSASTGKDIFILDRSASAHLVNHVSLP
jgi:hypothetical protein